jgi:molybdopterin-guanine dinucleotide biosynthesis protein A
MPFLNPELLRAFAGWADGYDVVVLRHAPPPPPPLRGGDVPEGQGGQFIEPLHAAYRRTCLPAIEAAIRARERRIVSFFPRVRVRTITPEEVAAIDPDLHSFRNINTPEEWETVRAEWMSR